MASCAASLTAPSLSPSSGSGCRRGLRGRERVREPQGPCEGREAMETVIACVVTAVLSSMVTLVAYACCVAAGNADRREEGGE